jgi:hypothetical protein
MPVIPVLGSLRQEDGVLGQPELYSETVSKTEKTKNSLVPHTL